MKKPLSSYTAPLVALLCGAFTFVGYAQTTTQTITLQPGWNSVYLEVQPSNNTANAVFGGLPLASVWTRAERLSSVDYIQNPSEATFNESGWLAWLPAWRTESFLNNLFSVSANRAYLVKSTNATPVLWSLTGRPSLRQPVWVTDSYNLRGLPVDPAAPPTFLSFFRYSKAHFNSTNGLLEKIYRLNGAGQWALVSSNDFTASGEAYWIYTRGASDYQSPLQTELELGDGLEFGEGLAELQVKFKNATTSPMNAMVQDLGGSNALSYYQFNPTAGGQWSNLPSTLVTSPAAGADARLRVGVRRQDVAGSNYATVLQIKNGQGVRLFLPVSAAKGTSAPGANALAGLWVGPATINAVSEAHSANPSLATPTRSEMSLRLLLHVNTNGQTRLLKEVIQMWRDGTYTNDGSGGLVVDKSGQYVLLTDDTLIGQFKGAALRDGQSVGRRMSTVGYDFPSASSSNYLTISGSFAVGQTLSATLTLPYDHPNNPFKHKFHPDHDNLNTTNGPAIESYTVTRQVQLQLTASPPPGPPVPDYGYNVLGGNYSETITGLHKNSIHISGTFRLRRISYIAALNPSPTP